MFNIRDFLENSGLPRVSQLQNCITTLAMSAMLVLGSLHTGAELAFANAAAQAAPPAAHIQGGSPILYVADFENAAIELNVEIVRAFVSEPPQYESTPECTDNYVCNYNYECIQEYIPEYVPAGGMPYRVMYLTFDDGPTRAVTPKILDILAERGIHATFFVVGRNVRANPDIMQRIVDEGHTVGIHSDTHDYNQIYASLEAFINDFKITRELIAEFTGYYSDIYRFPGGSVTRFNANVRNAAIDFLDSIGVVYFDWNASIDDSIGGNPTPDQLLARGLQTINGDMVIMLAHDTQINTAKMMGRMIDILAEDFIFDVLTSDVEPVQMLR